MEEQTGKEAYEAKKAAKEEGRSTQQNDGSAFLKKAKPWLVTLIILGALGGGLFYLVARELPKGEDLSREIPIQGREHIAVGAEHEGYNSNPPTSGPHYEQTAAVRFYDVGNAPADEHVVHNLEHGDIWISYHPSVSESVKGQLRDFAGPKVLVAPREANDTDIALSAWGRLDTFDLEESGRLPEQRIKDFITRYINKGPEKVSAPQFVR